MNYQTKNYDLFHNNPDQRKYNPLKTARLVEDMRQDGFRESLCISTYKEKGKLYINAGHHRLEAARILGLAVWYVVEAKWSPSALAREGTAASNWTTRDICQMYAAHGNRDYADLLEYSKDGMAPEMAAALLGGGPIGGHGIKATLKNGSFRIRTRDHIEEVLAITKTLAEKHTEANTLNFIRALSSFLRLDGFSSVRFVQAVNSQLKLDKCATSSQMMEQLEEMYNYKQRTRDNIAFRAKEAFKSLRLSNLIKPKKQKTV